MPGGCSFNLLPEAANLEGQGRGVVRLDLSPKATYLEGRCRGVIRLELYGFSLTEGRCRGVVPFRVPIKED